MLSNWDIFTDFAVAGGLLLIGKWLRANVILLQKLYLPAALIAGMLALAFGPAGLDLLPWSSAFASNASVLTVMLFASLGLATDFPSMHTLMRRAGSLWAFNQIATVSQWAFAAMAGLGLIALVWPELPPAFGIVMPAGFMGGHGTGVVVGETLQGQGWEDALTLALTTATVGIFASILCGMGLMHLGVKKGWIKNFATFNELSFTERRGLIVPSQQQALARNGVSSVSIDVFAMHAAVLLLVTMLGYHGAKYLSSFHHMVQVPAFVAAFVLGLVARLLMRKSQANRYFDDAIFSHATGSATDFLIVFGVGAIKITILMNYALPIAVLMIIGLLFNLFLVLVVAPRILGDNWFEKAIFSWGWLTGTVGMGIALLRIADPKMRSKVLDDYAIAYVPGSITDLIIVSMVPILMMQGMAHIAIGAMWVYVAAVVAIWLLFLGGKNRLATR
ncbi:sodium/glutamate symporter [Ferrimonas lipolytica]|uniref:Sodium:glutamate symporter n=1 Tax=Ferrimonas lipolytica TaxID=2724191 RepID=A0A6H1UAR6_9GAMM|nr:sodium:glutamate symporter [Ferrimonas lipolytica]QIZ75453.1 sodium:glutamate symporter [Ferrimonas lipolytica]